jgi:hypothetical protein
MGTFYLRVYSKSSKMDYMTAMEKDRHSIHYDRGMDVYDIYESDIVKDNRSQSIDRLMADPGLCVGKYEQSYTDMTLDNRRYKIPELISRLWCYVKERDPIIDSLSIQDLVQIFDDSEQDDRIMASLEDFQNFLNNHIGGRLYCFYL